MKRFPFRIYKRVDGKKTDEVVTVFLPETCCGITTVVNDPVKLMYNGCAKHFSTHEGVWEVSLKTDPFKCTKCKTYNEYADSNQPDGSYRCWSCRNGW